MHWEDDTQFESTFNLKTFEFRFTMGYSFFTFQYSNKLSTIVEPSAFCTLQFSTIVEPTAQKIIIIIIVKPLSNLKTVPRIVLIFGTVIQSIIWNKITEPDF